MVEDSASNLELARDLLELEGHQVISAEGGVTFRPLMTSGPPPAVILMDILLRDSDGVTLLGEIRRTPALAHVPVVALTAQALKGDAERLISAGFDGVMTKPIDTRAFVGEVERWALRGRVS
jgi:CheY-like chemotaxis protein